MNNYDVLNFAMDLGETLLKSGAETYRVEDTISRILSVPNTKPFSFKRVSSFVTPTIITTSVSDDTNTYTVARRVKNRSTRMDKIEFLNQLSRDYVSGHLSLEKAMNKLIEINSIPAYSFKVISISMGISASCFCVIFGGKFTEFIICFLMGCFTSFIQKILSKKKLVNYFSIFIIALTIGIVSMVSKNIFHYILTEAMIIGGIMSLVPGVAFTNAIRDTIGDELLSGISRGIEALFIAIVIAVGVGIPINVTMLLGGLI
ncbi:hypothetical protein AN639_12865 [Candidatus Epulonipiscium fishelsonii]|uniref:Uncharacterized protein n=1 Tax=Candidatus Epulonipiscium fishelsonii TaxID=77094 RepID=A0ACC8XDH6_9FIRM|nr:hypothetical protein AN396_00810 [Epulopiscium sp. SCG-B11WGA-EpuloA1]ONI42182.1 hypothetical protein AN639_12865 [Epulopiscium sp. SCG-B05WGA-EpuloA1]